MAAPENFEDGEEKKEESEPESGDEEDGEEIVYQPDVDYL